MSFWTAFAFAVALFAALLAIGAAVIDRDERWVLAFAAVAAVNVMGGLVAL